MDFDGEAEVFGVTTGAAGGVLIDFAVSRASELATLDVDDGVAFSETDEGFGELDFGADG
jgi:hypothetical protein